MKKRPDGIKTYKGPAGGWGALKAVAEALSHQNLAAQGAATLLKANQPEGFDCPGCAWPDSKHTSSLRDGDLIDIHAVTVDGPKHTVHGYTAVAYDLPPGSVGGYYPEMNAVVAIGHYDRLSGTPAYKGVPVRIVRSASA
ncbi:putative oxidoreductase [Martelella mediterranea DSM 17316]|uniref:Putative oxidoreductase n=1 Tax=Martelella mediterranea DSM 17316 TaxID=1122214 RepID=A0A1U9Z3G6_9HYPH|nr:putative oxidoreductase [Martelella mediterranea DSM 17316]